jgi:Mg2+ and Co2+ transporter CorA
VYVVNDGELRATESDWKSCLAWAREPDGSWFHATNLDPDRFTELAHAAGVSDRELQRALAPDGAAMIRQELRHTALILQVPAVADTGFPEVERDRFFAIVGDRGLLTASTGTGDLKGLVLSQLADVPNLPFPAKIVSALLAAIRECNLRVAQRFNDEQLRLETIEGGHVFLQDTFRLRREISTTALDLWHFKNAVRALADGKVRLGGVDLKNEKFLDDLVMEAESLYETVNGSKEEVQTLIELHINVKSFEMNKFLKVLAVVSFLGLIPSVVGGLLGMNVAGNPWPVTLGHVAFGVAMTMATSLYVFAVKGWLR